MNMHDMNNNEKDHHLICSKGLCCSSNLCCTKINNFNVARGNTQILQDVNLHIHCGELTALIGPNGAGKSTLLKAILGQIRHTGTLQFMDEKGVREGKPIIGYVPQQLPFDKSTPVSVMDLFTACKTGWPVWFSYSKNVRQSVIEALQRVNVENLIDRKLGTLSGGEMQRVLLALALSPLPDILLLDEPISGIDRKGMEMFYNTVSELRNNYDMTIVLVSHDLPLAAKYADRVVLLNKKVLCTGTSAEVFRHPEFEKVFGRVIFDNIN